MEPCGIGSFCRPRWMQGLATTRVFLVVYGLLGTVQAMSYIYFVSTLTTIEKRFKITSKTTGYMLSGNEISQIMLSLFLSYYGGQRNRPVWIAWGVAFSATSCFILALPHFLYGAGDDALALTKEYLNTHQINTSTLALREKTALCSNETQQESPCEADLASEFAMAPVLVFASQFVLGIGTTLYFALGQPYIDDNTKKTNTPMLLGLTLALRTVGPAFGFIVGYGCLSVYIDPSLTPIINSKDPRWLGAWWLGWLILGSTMLLFSFLIAMFPKKLPRQEKVIIDAKGQVVMKDKQFVTDTPPSSIHNSQLTNNNFSSRETFGLDDNDDQSPTPSLKEFPEALMRLLRNKLLIVNIFSGVFYILGGAGYITYITKYLEIQFNKVATEANIVIGPTAIFAMVLGFLLSGLIISKFRPSPPVLLGWNVIVGSCFVLGEILFIFISCKDNNLVGYDIESRSIKLENECNTQCSCDNLKYSPVCYQEASLTFYTPCHAGCTTKNRENSTFSECSCIPGVTMGQNGKLANPPRWENIDVDSGPCKLDCGYNFIIFIAASCFMHVLGSSGKIGNILVNYRAVRTEDKSFAQGLSLLLISLLSFIPGPIIYGAIIDSTCLIWDETCGQKGNCLFYEKDDFRFKLNSTAAALTSIGVLLDAIVCYLGRDLDLYGDKEEETNSYKEETQPKQDGIHMRKR